MSGKAKLEATYFTHRILWGVLADLRKELDNKPESVRSIGVAALLLAHNCFEAYLNYAGEILLPALWVDERKSFGSDPYRGLMGKLERLLKEMSIKVDRGRRPYTTLRKMKTWRDRVVHTRTEKLERVISFKDPKYIKNLRTEFFKDVTLTFIDRAIQDVETLCDMIQAEACKRYPGKFLGPGSFKGILGTTGGSLLS